MKIIKLLLLASFTILPSCLVYGQDAASLDTLRATEKRDESSNFVTAASYALSAQSGIALEDMSSGTTQLIAAGSDSDNSPLGQVGFVFRFDNGFYTSFGANANGFIKLGSVTTGPSDGNSLASTQNTPKIMPYWDDLCVGSSGKVHYKTVGSPGSLKLVVEWSNMKITKGNACDGSGSGTFQMWLFERTGVIQFVYGNGMQAPAPANSGYSVGIQSGPAANFASITTFNATVSYTTANDVQAAAITPGTSFLLTPNIPAQPTGGSAGPVTQTSITLNWTDNANNETGYLVRRTTDNVNFYFIGYLGPDATTFTDTGLPPGTAYSYYINALSEGAFSPDLIIPTSTNPAGTVSATAAGGSWSAPSTWASGAVPTAGDNVTIPNGSTVIIDTAAVALSVTVGTEGGAPAALRFGETAAFSLTVTHDVTIGSNGAFTTGGGNANQHVLVVSGNLTNNGTLDFSTNNNLASAGIIFTGDSSNTFGGTGPVTDIRSITINKGPSSANVLELSVANFSVQGSTTDGPASGFLFLNEGTFKISGTFAGNHRTFASAAYQITAAAGLWLNNPNYTIAPQSSTVQVFGLLRVSAGTYNVGTAINQSLDFLQGSNVIVEGGNINTAANFETASNGQFPFRYNQTGGNITVCTVPNFTGNCGGFSIRGAFNPGDNVLLTGGNLTVQNAGGFSFSPTSGPTLDSYDSVTVRFGNAQTAQPSIFASANHLPHLILDTTVGGHTLTIAYADFFPITNVRSVNIGPGGTINLTGAKLKIASGWTFVNNGFITSTQTTSGLIFTGPSCSYSGTGSVPAAIGAVESQCTTFSIDSVNNLRVRSIALYSGDIIHAGKITLGNNDAISNSVLIGKNGIAGPVGHLDEAPVFDLGTGGQRVTYENTGASYTMGPEINPGRDLLFFAFNAASPSHNLVIAGGDLTVKDLSLPRGRVIGGSRNITHSGSMLGSGSGYIFGTYTRKFVASGVTWRFPIGINQQSPFSITVTALGANPSYLSVTPVHAVLPGLLPANSLAEYWKISEIGDITGDMGFTYEDPDVRGNEPSYRIWRSVGGGTPVQMPSQSPNVSQNVITGGRFSDWNGDWGVGAQLDPGPVSISGTITTSGGQPIRNAIVTISGGALQSPVEFQTGNFGTYNFSGLQAGETYTIRVDAKRFRFSPNTQQVTPFGNIGNVNFTANPQE